MRRRVPWCRLRRPGTAARSRAKRFRRELLPCSRGAPRVERSCSFESSWPLALSCSCVLPLDVGRIAELAVQADRRSRQALRFCSAELVALRERDRSHLVLAAGLQPLVETPQPLAAPEAE